MSEINKNNFKVFAKIVLFCCNYSKRKVYIRHLKIMIAYYFTKYKLENNTDGLIEFSIDSVNGVDIMQFDNYLAVMQSINFIEFENNLYGTVVVAKKKLEDNAYNDCELEILRDIVKKSIDELQNYIGVNIQFPKNKEDFV